MSLPLSGYTDREQTDTEAEVSAEGRTLDPPFFWKPQAAPAHNHPTHPRLSAPGSDGPLSLLIPA